MKPNDLALLIGAVVTATFLWLYLSGVGYPASSSSLFAFLVCLVSTASLFFNSRRSLLLSTAVSALSLVYSLLLLLGHREGPEYVAIAVTTAFVLTATYALTRFGKARYLTPLDMPVYG
ncbi:MAG TPA: hypothetical protein VMS77_09165 [Conexivisphaerales archaeon]|nr:hypothetical protein [Conexivisphaerales archaeon]